MRKGYAIRDKHNHCWLKTRAAIDGIPVPVTVWVQDEADAMEFKRLKDARRMLKVIRAQHRRPYKIQIMDPRWRVIA